MNLNGYGAIASWSVSEMIFSMEITMCAHYGKPQQDSKQRMTYILWIMLSKRIHQKMCWDLYILMILICLHRYSGHEIRIILKVLNYSFLDYFKYLAQIAFIETYALDEMIYGLAIINSEIQSIEYKLMKWQQKWNGVDVM